MTTVSFKDAAVLSYLSRHNDLGKKERAKLAGTLRGPAKKIAHQLEKTGPAPSHAGEHSKKK
jgi:hypothetical protein